MKPHIWWNKTHGHYMCALSEARCTGRGRSPREAYHAFMIANGFKLKVKP